MAAPAVGEPPVNDDCPFAFDVGPLPASALGDTTAATTDVPVSCGVNVDGPFKNVWYSVVGTGGTLTATTCSVDTVITDTEIAIYCGDCDFPTCVDGNDDNCVGPNVKLSTISWCSEPGRTYLITVGGAQSATNTGVFELGVTDAGDECEFPINCEQETGACCIDDECVETTTADLCNGEFYPGETCPEFLCPVFCPCDDGIFCNGLETCDGLGGCIPGTPLDCSHLSDDCNVGICDEDLDMCVQQPVANNTPCDDGLFCTTGEVCVGGQCQGGAPTDCSHLDDDCVVGVCDENANMCVAQPVANNTPCDDGLFCTISDACIGGVCLGGPPRDCSAVNGECVIGVCDEIGDTCVQQPVGDNAPCDDGFFCTTGEVCLGGQCQGGTPTDCSHLNDDCAIGVCDEMANTCVQQPVADNTPCDDGLFCTTGEACISGQCQGGSPADCSHLNGLCVIGVCDELADSCASQPFADNTPCDDGLFCTDGEACLAGNCQGGTPPTCTDNIGCTLDACDEANDVCTHTPDNVICDDGSACTTDACNAMLGCQASDNGLCGACCDSSPGSGGVCFDGVLAAACVASGQVFYPGADCDGITCVEVAGACCDGTTGTCTVTAQAACNCDLCIWTQGADCDSVQCLPPVTPIPTVSQWGLVVLALALLTGLKLRVREAAFDR